MEIKKINVKYKGVYEIIFSGNGFRGEVKPGEVIKVNESSIEFFVKHKDWEVESIKKESKKKESK